MLHCWQHEYTGAPLQRDAPQKDDHWDTKWTIGKHPAATTSGYSWKFKFEKHQIWDKMETLIQRNNANEYIKDHIFVLWRKIWRHDWSWQLYTQLTQLWKQSLKKSQAWMGFKPMISAMPVQCSTNWAIKLSGSLSHNNVI